MYYKIEVINNLNIYFSINIMLRRSFAESTGNFWWPKIRKSGKSRFQKSQALAKHVTFFSDRTL